MKSQLVAGVRAFAAIMMLLALGGWASAAVLAAPVITTIDDNVGTPANGGNTNDPTISIVGTAVPGETVTVTRSGVGDLGETTAAEDSGGWVFDYTGTTLSDGTYSFTARITGDNSSPSSASFQVVVDTVTPAPPVVLSITNDTGQSNSDFITSDQTIEIRGTAEPGASVAYHVDGDHMDTVTANASGNWFIGAGDVFPDGLYVGTARQTDLAGNVSAFTEGDDLIFDTEAPAAPVITGFNSDTGVPDDGITNDQSLQIFGTAEPDALVTLRDAGDNSILDEVTADMNGDWEVTLEGNLPAGQHSAKAKQKDLAGNSSPFSDIATVTIDLTAPAAPTLTIEGYVRTPTAELTISDSTLIFEGTAVPGADVEVIFVNGDEGVIDTVTADPDGNWSLDNTVDVLDDGDYAFTAAQYDAAGNRSAEASMTVHIDTAVPDVPTIDGITTDTGIDATDGITSDRTISIFGTGEPGASIRLGDVGEEMPPVEAVVDGGGQLELYRRTSCCRRRVASGCVPRGRRWKCQ